ncbi:MAG: sulfotransferase family protein [Actinomycetota bacterium]|nr:sulfotransferase family protein [Actinomycetota bacterium]
MLTVIGAGAARTGTLSLKIALEQLGFGPCDHMYNVIASPDRMRQWLDIAQSPDKAEADWDTVLAGYESTTDWPGAVYWRELAAHYPDAKVILTVRGPQSWYDSVFDSIYQVHLHGRDNTAATAAPVNLDVQLIAEMTNTIIWQGLFGGRFSDREHAIGIFQRSNAEVREAIDPARLLVFDVAAGWAPLCEFLSVPVPEGRSFPHANDRAEYGTRHPVKRS